VLEEIHDPKLRVFAVWEPVLATDMRAPSTTTLRRLRDPRVSQFWDKERLLSHAMGEHGRSTIVWDYIAIYDAGKEWKDSPPEPVFAGRTVVSVIPRAAETLKRFSAPANDTN